MPGIPSILTGTYIDKAPEDARAKAQSEQSVEGGHSFTRPGVHLEHRPKRISVLVAFGQVGELPLRLNVLS